MRLLFKWPDEVEQLIYRIRKAEYDITLSDFCNIIESIVQRIPVDGQLKEKTQDKFRGDMTEILSWRFFHAFKHDPKVGLGDYECCPIETDHGVDGIGINILGQRVVVQVKYKGDLSPVTFEELGKTFSSGMKEYHYNLMEDDTLVVFTTGNGVTHVCIQVFGTTLRVIDRAVIEKYINNNKHFWKFFCDTIFQIADAD